MFAGYEYYKSVFKGTKITSADEYAYLGQQASTYIKRHTNNNSENVKACECEIAEYLQSSKKQGNMTSESIPNFYSASWGANDKNTRISEIDEILERYLGCEYSSVGIVKVIG